MVTKYKTVDIRERVRNVEGIPVKVMAVTYEVPEWKYRGTVEILKADFKVEIVKARIEAEIKTLREVKAL
jgi:hypothetical protein